MLLYGRIIISLVSFILCLNPVAVKSVQTGIFISTFIRDDNCSQLFKSERTSLLLTTMKSKTIECVGRCAQQYNCQYIKSFSDANSGIWCEHFKFEVSSASSAPTPTQSTSSLENCYRRNNDLMTTTNESGNKKTEEKTFCDKNLYHNSDAYKSEWIVITDTDKPETQTARYMKQLKESIEEIKSVILLPSGLYYAIVNSYTRLSASSLKMGMTYVIEENNQQFAPNGSRIIYTSKWNGRCLRTYSYINGTSYTEGFPTSRVRTFTQRIKEHTLLYNNDEKNVSTLISWLKQGYEVLLYNYATISWYDSSTVSLYRINDIIKTELNGNPEIPLLYTQRVEVFPGAYNYRANNRIGTADRQFSFSSPASVIKIFLSPFWKSVIENCDDVNEQIVILSRYMNQGHKFRVGIAESFFDVDEVIKMGNEMYFVLPQQINSSNDNFFSYETTGTRAVVSLRGYLSWCNHLLEGEQVLGTGLESDLQILPFVDKKEWISVLSVYSNGTITSGTSTDLAEAVIGGKDIGVLIKFLMTDITKRLTLTFMTVSNYGKDDVLITGQSKVSWNLKFSEKKDCLIINSECNMEKVLVSSTGHIEVLVYNVVVRKPVSNLDGALITWFTF